MNKRLIFVIMFVLAFTFFSCDSTVSGLIVKPTDYNFGDVSIGNTKVVFFEITNSSDDTIRISKFQLLGINTSSYKIADSVPSSVNVLSNHSTYLTIEYTPNSTGTHEIIVQIYYGIGGLIKIKVKGNGVPASRIEISRNIVNFGLVYNPDSKVEDVLITNTGSADLVLTFDFEDTNITEFTVKSGTSTPVIVVPGDTYKLEIEFTPVSDADLTNNLLITHDAIGSPLPLKIFIEGYARKRYSNIDVDRTSPWDFGNGGVTIDRVFDLKISSYGDKDLVVSAIDFATGTEFSLLGIEDSQGAPLTLPISIPDSDFVIAKVKFMSTSNGNFNDTLSIQHEGSNVSSPVNIALEASAQAITTKTYNYSGKIEYWTVPQGVKVVVIEAWGAEGGLDAAAVYAPGKGAQIKGTFNVTPGEKLKIMVGQQGTNNGGGGGSFVVRSNIDYILVAGGGGGSASKSDSTSKHGQITTDGGDGAGKGGIGGKQGKGGEVGTTSWNAGGGGGFYTDGERGQGMGGVSFVNGGTAGSTGYGLGGYGGGGDGGISSLSNELVGGGGGGYSGGGGGGDDKGGVGGGGGSYNSGTNQDNKSGANSGDGKIVISY